MFTFAASENKLQDVKGERLGYYRNPNQGGNSGSNVKWSDWE